MSDVEDTFKRLLAIKGVNGAIIMNSEGIVIRTSLQEQALSTTYAATMQQVVAKVQNAVKDLDSSNSATFVRLRTRKYEIMIAPDKEFFLLVIQNPDVTV